MPCYTFTDWGAVPLPATCAPLAASAAALHTLATHELPPLAPLERTVAAARATSAEYRRRACSSLKIYRAQFALREAWRKLVQKPSSRQRLTRLVNLYRGPKPPLTGATTPRHLPAQWRAYFDAGNCAANNPHGLDTAKARALTNSASPWLADLLAHETVHNELRESMLQAAARATELTALLAKLCAAHAAHQSHRAQLERDTQRLRAKLRTRRREEAATEETRHCKRPRVCALQHTLNTK